MMATAVPTVQTSKFFNWIKAALAVLYTKEEVEPVVVSEIKDFQQNSLNTISSSNSLPAGSTCSNCCTENLIVCLTNRLCNAKRGKCSYHKNNATQYRQSGCPNKICHNLKFEIQKAHRYHGPSYKNTDATKWCSNVWEIAKCYLPPDGYKDVSNAAETDFNGIISVIINHKGFEAKIQDDLSKKNNIFEKGRDVGRAVRHSPNLEVEDTDLTQYFTILNNILTDPGFVAMNKSPNNAIQKLAKLQSDDLIIGKDVVRKVLDDVRKTIQEQIKNEMNEYKQKTEERKLELINIINLKVKDIEEKGNVSLVQLNGAVQSSIDAFEAKVKESIQEIDSQTKKGKETLESVTNDGVQNVNKEKENAMKEIQKAAEKSRGNDAALKSSIDAFDAKVIESIQEIDSQTRKGKETIESVTNDGVQKVNKEKENAIKEIQKAAEKSRGSDANAKISEDTYQKKKEELKDGLIEFYKTRHSKVFLSPLFEENDTPLASFYIRPELNLINSAQTRNAEKRQVISLSAMLKTGNQAKQEIHVIADAGLGKTAFSNYLAITWCQAHFPEEYMTQSFEKDDIDCMQGYDFLFLVLLRDSNNLCSIDDLIFEKIVSDLGLEEKPSQDFLLKILKNEKCLVILDGLDEWIHPENECHRSPQSFPHRNDRKKCTILTTTRPWKLGVLNLNSCQIGKKVELTKLSYDSAVTLTERILQRLKSHLNKDELQSDVTEFISEIESRENDELTSVPLLLIYTICLWCDDVQIGTSKCELYIDIVELLLSRTIQKHGDLQQLFDLSDIPECFAEYENCTKYYPLLMCLGKLAYYTLFNKTRENTLVFDGLIAKKYLSADEMKFTLHSGMLSESTSKTLTKKFSKMSFSHKTVQEFFAAIFISSENEAQEIVVEKCRNIQDILDMSKIYEFISKMNADRICEISNDLMSVINEDKETRHYRTRTFGHKYMYNKCCYNAVVTNQEET
ncbi:uncharacterized protein LOC132743564 [Ruditapes philippinarum]|uniref:uncharacterized protein LOC132743564 n=1 Tax=Ruditapes philippinarum TaxID=129788 RepID=UPI00295BC3B7|nr:uncharacterized protein LOC132743564 [Ruditapes philippinarum]